MTVIVTVHVAPIGAITVDDKSRANTATGIRAPCGLGMRSEGLQ